jgi:serine/threonine kinase 32
LPSSSPRNAFQPLQPQLLERDTSKRFGCKENGEGFQELRRHGWFKPIDWDALEGKELPPPFVPDVSLTVQRSIAEVLIYPCPL